MIFQMLYILSVLQEEQLYFRELSLEKNFYIKDLYYDQVTTNYWIYKIDNFEYYVPNYGYLVVFDSKYSDIDAENINYSIITKNIREYKICSNNLFLNNNGSTDSNSDYLYYTKFNEIFNPNSFISKIKNLGGGNISTSSETYKLIEKIFNSKIPDSPPNPVTLAASAISDAARLAVLATATATPSGISAAKEVSDAASLLATAAAKAATGIVVPSVS